MVELAAGQLITPSIRLDRVFGRGGMGSLWMAYHLRLKVQVVVKFIANELAGNPDAIARFEREAAATMAAKGAYVVQILDYGLTEQKVPFIAMEYLEGEDLAAKIAREVRIAPREFAEILRQACKGLTRAHAQGIIHRDIKPENIFLTYVDGELAVKVLDFGIAKADSAAFGFEATSTGVFLGTVYYMSPEQAMGAKNVDHRTDLWSLGVVAYYALTGERPFDADAIGALVTRILGEPIAPPSRHLPALGSAIDRWMSKALARDARQRFGAAKDMATAFDAAVGQVVGWTAAVRAELANVGPNVAVESSRQKVESSPQKRVDHAIADAAAGPGLEAIGSPKAARKSGAHGTSGGAGPSGTVRYSSIVPGDASGSDPTAPAQTATPAATSASIRASAVGSPDQTAVMPPKSYRPLLIGIGIGACLMIALGLGLSIVQGRRPSSDPNEARSGETQSAPATAAARPSAVVPEPNPTSSSSSVASASASDAHPSSSSDARSPAPTPIWNPRPAARPSAVGNDNPFNGTY
jgi:eukaryotic-like serine/threonine-protein kinase